MFKMQGIVARSKNNVIGIGDKLPWVVRSDMLHFKKTTKSKVCIVGRKTYEVTGDLPDRTMIVFTRDHTNPYPTDAIVIGGAQCYDYFIDKCNHFWVTEIDCWIEGENVTKWEYDFTDWQLVSEQYHPSSDRNQYACRILEYIR